MSLQGSSTIPSISNNFGYRPVNNQNFHERSSSMNQTPQNSIGGPPALPEKTLKDMTQDERSSLLLGRRVSLVILPRSSMEAQEHLYSVPVAVVMKFCKGIRRILLATPALVIINISPYQATPDAMAYVLGWLQNTCRTSKSYKLPLVPEQETNVERYQFANLIGLEEVVRTLKPALFKYIADNKERLPYSFIDKVLISVNGNAEDPLLKHLVSNITYAYLRNLIPEPKLFEAWVLQRPALHQFVEAEKALVISKYDAAKKEEKERKQRRAAREERAEKRASWHRQSISMTEIPSSSSGPRKSFPPGDKIFKDWRNAPKDLLAPDSEDTGASSTDVEAVGEKADGDSSANADKSGQEEQPVDGNKIVKSSEPSTDGKPVEGSESHINQKPLEGSEHPESDKPVN